jgi:hypothetical protein
MFTNPEVPEEPLVPETPEPDQLKQCNATFVQEPELALLTLTEIV